MSIFGISILNLKKTIHFTYFGVRPPIFAGLPLWCGKNIQQWSRGDHYGADLYNR
uniref:Uncharacterized protein n=1 Tax=viral metagenome TaxID=1070528 RepID=A0A6C0EW89_9ZZZZ